MVQAAKERLHPNSPRNVVVDADTNSASITAE